MIPQDSILFFDNERESSKSPKARGPTLFVKYLRLVATIQNQKREGKLFVAVLSDLEGRTVQEAFNEKFTRTRKELRERGQNYSEAATLQAMAELALNQA